MITITEEILKTVVTKRPDNSYKGNFGRAVLIGGNQQYGGAIAMAAEACLNSGAGLTTVITHKDNHSAIHARTPEVMVVDWQDYGLMETTIEQADVLLIGPGLGLDQVAVKLLQFILKKQTAQQWLVIDGSALTLLSRGGFHLGQPKQTVLTPHQMEWQRLSGLKIAEQTSENNALAQSKLGCLIVVKSHRTEIYDDQTIYQNTTGNPGMATGGTGDVLAGTISGFLAQFGKNSQTIAAAVYLHSYVGDQIYQENYVVRPTAISKVLPFYMKKISAT